MKRILHMNNINVWGKLFVYSCLLAVFTLVSCGDDQPDVSGIEVKLETRRLDRDLLAIDTNHTAEGLIALKQQYPDFLDFYLDTLMGFRVYGNYTDTNMAISQGVRSLLTIKDYRNLFDTVEQHFPDTKETEEELTKGFKYMKHYFPDYKVPEVIYLITALNKWSAFTYDDKLCIGLDMFLGQDYPYYKSVGIEAFMYHKLDKNFIPVASFQTIYREMHPMVIDRQELLEMMIDRGKEMYFLKKVLPFLPEYERMGYTKEQLQWCKNNEAQIYNFFIQNELLYERSVQKVVRYVMDGPNATGMPEESPGSIGSFIGYRIIEKYMDAHPSTSLSELLSIDKTAQAFLLESKYKP